MVEEFLLRMNFLERNLGECIRMREHAAVRIGFVRHARTRRFHSHRDLVDGRGIDQAWSVLTGERLEVELKAGKRLPLGIEVGLSDERKRFHERPLRLRLVELEMGHEDCKEGECSVTSSLDSHPLLDIALGLLNKESKLLWTAAAKSRVEYNKTTDWRRSISSTKVKIYLGSANNALRQRQDVRHLVASAGMSSTRHEMCARDHVIFKSADSNSQKH